MSLKPAEPLGVAGIPLPKAAVVGAPRDPPRARISLRGGIDESEPPLTHGVHHPGSRRVGEIQHGTPR